MPACLLSASLCMPRVQVAIEPWSAGSGIPEAKCVLNGINITQILSPRTVLCKVVGVIFALASGLPVGKEGPMIHAGAAIGANVAIGPRCIKFLSEFRNDRDKRDFAAMGTAAGVASAFRTPIGGVLFAIEEGASYWNSELTWRAFTAACVAIVTVYLLRSRGLSLLTDPLDSHDMFIFGQFSSATDTDFYFWELIIFTAMGVLGGLMGVCFIAANKQLNVWRRARLGSSRVLRLAELVCLVTLVSVVAWFLPLAAGRCRPVPTHVEGWSESGVRVLNSLVRHNCPAGHYNELASLFLVEPDQAIKALFHLGNGTLSWHAPALFFVAYFALECLTPGAWVCSGVFIPTLLSGAALGRCTGQLLGRNPRTYSIMGAGSLLGGVMRMLISLTVIITEASGWVLFVLPLMVVFLAARSAGNHFNDGMNDTQILARRIPFLQHQPPESIRQQNVRVHQIMTQEVKCLQPVETVERVYRTLRSCDHNCFPVIDGESRPFRRRYTLRSVLLGTILRKTLLVLLARRRFAPPSADDASMPRPLPVLAWGDLEGRYPKYPRMEHLDLSEEDGRCLIDLAAYVQVGPHSMNEHASAHRAYEMFRTLGLRHLTVVNHFNEVVGIISRENLLPCNLQQPKPKVGSPLPRRRWRASGGGGSSGGGGGDGASSPQKRSSRRRERSIEKMLQRATGMHKGA
ncbi:channel voltage activated chloride channel [Tribonema minus]|uniref:Chloride channel protein n=1 Tax=Tribonema minus TaxID=303371 RepID=A0A836CM41_9STRA|nr:channel voltage activated chloride channel [Tribonema minus]